MTDPKILFFDLENTAMLSYHWGRWSQDIRPVQTLEESRVMCFGAKWLGGKYVFKAAYEHGRDGMLETIRDLLTEADGVVTWNGARHDGPKIRTEFVLEGLTPPAPWKDIDLMRVAKRQFAFSSNSLDHVSQQLGVGQKVSHEGFFEIIPKVMAGDEAARRRFARYQKQDVLLLEKLYERLLPWIPSTMVPNAGHWDVKPVCTKPGCASSDIQWRGYAPVAAGLKRRYQCQRCGSWATDKRLIPGNEMR